jgi:xylulokinase
VIEVTLGIDVGTGSSKAGVVDVEGRLLAVGRCSHVNDEPEAGCSETDARRWFDSASSAVADVLAQRPDVEVVALGLSGQMHGVVLCDNEGVPTRPAVLWSDRRAEPRLAGWEAQLGVRLQALANPLVPGMAGPIIGALTARDPSAVQAARWALQPKDWLRYQLTGRVATDPSDASATLLWDARLGGWSAEVAEIFGVRHELLPPVLPSASPAGTLRPAPARALGLTPGLPVMVGAADTAAALMGAGVALGETQVSTGTGGQIATVIATPRADPSRRTHLYRTAQPTGWYAMAAIQNAGLAIDWALRVLGADAVEASAAFAATPPGANGVTFLPYLTGERTPHLDASLTARWVGLHPGASRASMLRAVYEGVAFALRDGLEALRAAGHTIDGALLAGGGSRATWWRQLLADALQIPLTVHDATDASVRGAALLALSAHDRSGGSIAPISRSPAIHPTGNHLADPYARYRKHASEALRTTVH